MKIRQWTRFTCVAAAFALTSVAWVPTSAAAPSAQPTKPAVQPYSYLLSLGDSLGFGYSGAKLAEFRSSNDGLEDIPGVFTGYTAGLASWLGVGSMNNLSCPGETSGTMITGECAANDLLPASQGVADQPWPLGTQPQLAAATQLLKGSFSGQRGVITVSIGADDVLAIAPQCTANPLCKELGPTLRTLSKNLSTILTTLRKAAPKSTIVVLTPYNPFGAARPVSNLAALALNATIGLTALLKGAKVADAYGPINVRHARDFDCGGLVYYCANPNSANLDVHPTDEGYDVIAGAFEKVLR